MSEISVKPEIERRKPGNFRLFGLLNPIGAILFSLGLMVAGICVNYVIGLSGTMLLQKDRETQEITLKESRAGKMPNSVQADFAITLDSLSVAAHTPVYEIQLLKEDTLDGLMTDEGMPPPRECYSTFPLTPMEIHKVPDSDFRFRLSAFYPNFSFTYTYPDDIDTIPPRAPGVMLKLKTLEGEAVATLRSDQPNKYKLADLVGFGAPLEFYWEPPEEMMAIRPDSISANRIVFSGKERKVYFLINGIIDSRPLEKGTFYEIPGKREMGFRLMHLFPDAAHLMAIPASEGTVLRNPVAEVQVWREGQRYQEIFLYPGRKAGVFSIPGTLYALVLDVSPKHELQFYKASVSVKDDKTAILPQQITIDRTVKLQGYRLKLARSRSENPDQVRIVVSKCPGNVLIYVGGGLLLSTLVLLLANRISGRTTVIGSENEKCQPSN